MPWLVIHSRERDLFLSGASAKRPTFTRDMAAAMTFDRAEKARQWIAEKTGSAVGQLALLRAPRKRTPQMRAT